VALHMVCAPLIDTIFIDIYICWTNLRLTTKQTSAELVLRRVQYGMRGKDAETVSKNGLESHDKR